LIIDEVVKGLRRSIRLLIIPCIFFVHLCRWSRAVWSCRHWSYEKRCYRIMRLYARGTNRKDQSMVTLKRRDRKLPTIVLYCQKLKTNFIHSEVNQLHICEKYVLFSHLFIKYILFLYLDIWLWFLLIDIINGIIR
jgi:hypothetical protein